MVWHNIPVFFCRIRNSILSRRWPKELNIDSGSPVLFVLEFFSSFFLRDDYEKGCEDGSEYRIPIEYSIVLHHDPTAPHTGCTHMRINEKLVMRCKSFHFRLASSAAPPVLLQIYLPVSLHYFPPFRSWLVTLLMKHTNKSYFIYLIFLLRLWIPASLPSYPYPHLLFLFWSWFPCQPG